MPDQEKSTLRQLKILVVALIFSNIVIGVYGFYVLRAIDHKYSSLIREAIPSLNELQTLTAFSVEAMRSTNPTAFGESTPQRAEMSHRARIALDHDRDLRGRVLKREWFANDTAERREFQDAGEAFSKSAASVITLLEASEDAEATRQREASLRPAFDHYLAAASQAADQVEENSLKTSVTLKEHTGSISKVILGLASWPVMLLSIFLLITAAFVATILIKVLFSREEAI